VFLEGEGFELGQRDRDVYAEIKETNVDKILYPNLFRWFNFVKKQLN